MGAENCREAVQNSLQGFTLLNCLWRYLTRLALLYHGFYPAPVLFIETGAGIIFHPILAPARVA